MSRTAPRVRRDVLKLLASVHARVAAGYFNRAEKQQVNEVYQLIGGTRNEMLTDDSFVFSKVRTCMGKRLWRLVTAATAHATVQVLVVLDTRCRWAGQPA